MNIIESIKREIPNNLYHYTDLNALIGIVSKKELWLTNQYFLNDRDEYKIGIRLIQDVFLEQKKKYLNNKKASIFLNTLDSAIELISRSNVFTISFSEEQDLLSQWRGYANNCKGVSIDFLSLKDFIESGIQLLPCIYDVEEHREYINYIFDSTMYILFSTKEENKTDSNNFKDEEKPYRDSINKAGSHFIKSGNVACSIIKNSSFKEEKEWRLIEFKDSEIYYRDKSHFILPFIKKEKQNLNEYINEIMVCATPEKQLTEKSIRYLLDNKSFKDTIITHSTIPYRF